MARPLPTRDEPASRENTPALTVLPGFDQVRESLVHALALDRIRELRYDGVTRDYIGRMYGVSGECIEELESELRRDRSTRHPPVSFD